MIRRSFSQYLAVLFVLFVLALLIGCPDGGAWPFGDDMDNDGSDLDLDSIPLIEVSSVETISPYSLKVTWPETEGVETYMLFRCYGSGAGNFILVDDGITDTFYLDKGLHYDSIYYYKVVAVVSDDPAVAAYLLNQSGTLDWGGRTEDVSSFVLDTVPGNFRTTDVYYDSITFAWDGVEGAEYYRIAVLTEEAEEFEYLNAVVDETVFVWTEGVEPESDYTLKVVAVKLVEYEGEQVEGRSDFSNTIYVSTLRRDLTLTVSSTPNGSVTAPGEGEFTLVRDEAEVLAALPDSGMVFEGWTNTTATVADSSSAATNVILSSGNGSVEAHFYDPSYTISVSDAQIDISGSIDQDNDDYVCGGANLEYKMHVSRNISTNYFLKIYGIWIDRTPQKVLLGSTEVRTYKETGIAPIAFYMESFSIPTSITKREISIAVEVWRPDRLSRDSIYSASDDVDLVILVETPGEDSGGIIIPGK